MQKFKLFPLYAGALVLSLVLCEIAAAQRHPPRARESQALAEPFKGVTTNGAPVAGLFPIHSTGVSTAPVVEAAKALLDALTPAQRAKTVHPIDGIEWRKWSNVHMYVRDGVGFDEMTEAQRELAFGLFRASLSAKGARQTRDIMRLNETLAEMTGKFDEYGEWLYWITIMGEPSAASPWGWQLDGHHVIINYFVLGDQVVMTPTFMGSEPVKAESGKYKGTVVMQEEQDQGLALAQALGQAQLSKASLGREKDPTNALSEAFRDNLVLDYAGLPASEITKAQQELLLATVEAHVGHMDAGHAKVRMAEVRRHLDQTYLVWLGGTSGDAVFYYRIQSPVILIEFDHQRPIGLTRTGIPSRQHIHAVVRTPNGNDYGKDLLRQHYERHPHDHL